MQQVTVSFGSLLAKTIVVHTVTYFLVGVSAFFLLDYSQAFSSPPLSYFMRPVDHPLVMAGPVFQPIRGLIFGLAFYPMRQVLFGRTRGWLILWWLLVSVGILSTFAAAPASVEGMIYTVIPPMDHLFGLPEILLQSLLLASLLFYWVNHPEKRWLNLILWSSFGVVLLLSTAGILASQGIGSTTDAHS